jgi:hypothetical protein
MIAGEDMKLLSPLARLLNVGAPDRNTQGK